MRRAFYFSAPHPPHALPLRDVAGHERRGCMRIEKTQARRDERQQREGRTQRHRRRAPQRLGAGELLARKVAQIRQRGEHTRRRLPRRDIARRCAVVRQSLDRNNALAAGRTVGKTHEQLCQAQRAASIHGQRIGLGGARGIENACGEAQLRGVKAVAPDQHVARGRERLGNNFAAARIDHRMQRRTRQAVTRDGLHQRVRDGIGFGFMHVRSRRRPRATIAGGFRPRSAASPVAGSAPVRCRRHKAPEDRRACRRARTATR